MSNVSPWRTSPMVKRDANYARMNKWKKEKAMSKDLEWIEVKILDSREKAIRIDYEGRKAWIPRSQIEDYSEEQFAIGDTIEIEIGQWILEEKGLV